TNQRLFEKLLDDDTLGDALLEMEQADTDSQIQYVFSALQLSLPPTGKTPAKVRPVGTVWRWVAAAAVIAAIVGSVWFFTDTESTRPVTSPHLSAAQPIVPGSDKAVLTLADGTQVLLD